MLKILLVNVNLLYKLYKTQKQCLVFIFYFTSLFDKIDHKMGKISNSCVKDIETKQIIYRPVDLGNITYVYSS